MVPILLSLLIQLALWFMLSFSCLCSKLVGQKDVSSERYALDNLNHLELKTGYTKYDLLGIAALLDIAPNLNTMVLNYLPKIEKDVSITCF